MTFLEVLARMCVDKPAFFPEWGDTERLHGTAQQSNMPFGFELIPMLFKFHWHNVPIIGQPQGLLCMKQLMQLGLAKIPRPISGLGTFLNSNV